MTAPIFGNWSAELKTLQQMGVNMPNLPPIRQPIPGYEQPDDPNLHIEFLKAIRAVVERDASIPLRIHALHEELVRPAWAQMVWRPGCDAGSLADFFFPEFLTLIPGVAPRAATALRRAGLATRAALREAPDAILLSLPGIGPASLVRIRAASSTPMALDHEDRLDTVRR